MFTELESQAILTGFSQLPLDRQNELTSQISGILLANRDNLTEETETMALQFHCAKLKKTGPKDD